MRLVRMILVATLIVLTLPALATAPAEATDRRGRFDGHRPGHVRRFHGANGPVVIVPQVVFVTPSRCWQAAYWTYQWVPQSYAYSTWVAGQWSPDGYWIEGHYAPSIYQSGYYQPLWVEGYWTRC
jgi:hypothetical protein